MITLGDPHSITGVVIMFGCTTIFAKTCIQCPTALSSTESETMASCDTGKDIKYFRRLFLNLRFPLAGPTPMGEDNQVTILIANHCRSSDCTRHMDLQFFVTHEWVQQGLM
jgi:hypothetical protein